MDAAALITRQRHWLARGESRAVAFRRDALRRLASAITGARQALIDALQADLRKGPYEVVSSEIAFVLAEIDFAVKRLAKWAKPARRPAPPMAWPARAWVRPEPLGVALILGPWNYPMQLTLAPLVGALAAGCSAILKPSELTPRTSAAIAGLIAGAFDPEYVAVVEGDHTVAEALLAERTDAIFFTGSGGVGRSVMSAAAKHLTPVTLELGGKCPCVVTVDADLALAGRRIAWGKMLNAGQTCVAPDYVLVDRRKRDELVAEIKRSLVRFFGDEPQSSPHFGRIVNRRHFDRVSAYLNDGVIAHGGACDAEDLFIAPTLLTDVPRTAPVLNDEIFGPVLPVDTFDSVDEAFARIADGDAPLAAYLFTRDAAVRDRFEQTVHAGGLCVNDAVVHLFGKHLPFGGVGASGMGRYHGKASFDAFTHYKTVVRGSGRFDLPWRYPPVRMPLARFEKLLRYFLGR